MKILFVCTGNVSRSCMAEAIFDSKCTDIQSVSKGIAISPNSITEKYSAKFIKDKLNIDISNRKSVQLTVKDVEDADLVITMTSYVKELLISNLPQYENKIFSLTQYIGEDKDIIDPIGGTIEDYEKTYFMLDKYIVLLIGKLKEDKNIT